jgi:predicted Rossmann fold nucleotide-binding protein DprA/Smf involved in DNA uptake
MRIKTEYKKPLEDGRLLMVSPFTGKEKRISSRRALRRNYFVAAFAETIFIPYAAPKSKTEMFCHELLKRKKLVYTIEDEKNKALTGAGVNPILIVSLEGMLHIPAPLSRGERKIPAKPE